MTNEYFDQFGIAIEHHDIVIWTDTTYTGKVNSYLGVVTGFTPKMVKVTFNAKRGPSSEYTIKTDRLICFKKINGAIEQYHGLYDILDGTYDSGED